MKKIEAFFANKDKMKENREEVKEADNNDDYNYSSNVAGRGGRRDRLRHRHRPGDEQSREVALPVTPEDQRHHRDQTAGEELGRRPRVIPPPPCA